MYSRLDILTVVNFRGCGGRVMESCAVRTSRLTVTVALPPSRAGAIETGVHEVLQSMMRTCEYNTDVGGLLLGYRKAQVLSSKAEVLEYLPFLKLDVNVTVTAFCPEKGMRLGTDQKIDAHLNRIE